MNGSIPWRLTAPLVAVMVALLAVGVFNTPSAKGHAPPDHFDPAVVNLNLAAGDSTTQAKELHLAGLPARADIIVAIDTTGSMGSPLAAAKLDANNICTTVQGLIPGARFAAVEFQDYPISPYGVATDDPYELHTPGFVANCATFSLAVNAMALGNGFDGPESYNRVNYEAYSDPAITGSRDPLATQFLVVLGDSVPHSLVALGACPVTAGLPDPGPDGIPGNADDLDTPETILGLNTADITLLMISYNTTGAHPCHVSMATATGGVAVDDTAAANIGAFIIANALATPYTVALSYSCVPAGPTISFSALSPPGPYTGPATIAFTETITAPTTPGNYTCTVTAVMTPGGPTTAVQTINLTVVAGPPATLTLTPETATNTVDAQHCVTATVVDAFGNPTPGVTVNFNVTGANATSGSGVTDPNGVATFCYTSALPGSDTITATTVGAVGSTNPTDTATKTWVVPTSTEGCKITDGGRITAANGDKATFGANAQAPNKGQQEYQDHGPAIDINVHSISITAVVCNPARTAGSIFGTATINGAGSFAFRIDVQDLGEPGTSDTYRIRLSNGYDSGVQVLTGGNIQIHK